MYYSINHSINPGTYVNYISMACKQFLHFVKCNKERKILIGSVYCEENTVQKAMWKQKVITLKYVCWTLFLLILTSPSNAAWAAQKHPPDPTNTARKKKRKRRSLTKTKLWPHTKILTWMVSSSAYFTVREM